MRLISCGSKKKAEASTAMHLYEGSLFKVARGWAVQSPDGFWGILSAQHGLLLPNDVIEPYDYTFKKAPEKWVDYVVDQLQQYNVQYEIAAPKRYGEPLRDKLPDRITLMLEGLGGIGFQMQYLKQNTRDE